MPVQRDGPVAECCDDDLRSVPLRSAHEFSRTSGLDTYIHGPLERLSGLWRCYNPSLAVYPEQLGLAEAFFRGQQKICRRCLWMLALRI